MDSRRAAQTIETRVVFRPITSVMDFTFLLRNFVNEWTQLIELQKQGRFPYDRMLKFYDMENINQAIADSESGTVVRPIVRMAHN